MSHARPQSTAPKTLGQQLLNVLWFMMIAWFVLLIPFGFISFSVGVPKDLRWVTCQVTDAEAEQTNDDEHPWRLRIESTDCPVLVYTDGVTDANATQLASTFEPGAYEVRIHYSAIGPDGQVRYAAQLNIHSYRPAPALEST